VTADAGSERRGPGRAHHPVRRQTIPGIELTFPRIAEERGSTLLQVVTDAVHLLSREQWWEAVQVALDEMTEDDLTSYRTEAGALDDGGGGLS